MTVTNYTVINTPSSRAVIQYNI